MRGSGFRRPTTADSTKTSKCARSPSVGRRPSATQLFVRAPARSPRSRIVRRSEEHTSELQSRLHLVCRLLLEKKKQHQRYSLHEPTMHTASIREQDMYATHI